MSNFYPASNPIIQPPDPTELRVEGKPERSLDWLLSSTPQAAHESMKSDWNTGDMGARTEVLDDVRNIVGQAFIGNKEIKPKDAEEVVDLSLRSVLNVLEGCSDESYDALKNNGYLGQYFSIAGALVNEAGYAEQSGPVHYNTPNSISREQVANIVDAMEGHMVQAGGSEGKLRMGEMQGTYLAQLVDAQLVILKAMMSLQESGTDDMFSRTSKYALEKLMSILDAAHNAGKTAAVRETSQAVIASKELDPPTLEPPVMPGDVSLEKALPKDLEELMGKYPDGVFVQRSNGAIEKMPVLADRVQGGYARGETEYKSHAIPEGSALVRTSDGGTKLFTFQEIVSENARLESIVAAKRMVDAAASGESDKIKSAKETAIEAANNALNELPEDQRTDVWWYAAEFKRSRSFTDSKDYKLAESSVAAAMDKKRKLSTEAARRVASLYEAAYGMPD
jgi:hypothetical protein